MGSETLSFQRFHFSRQAHFPALKHMEDPQPFADQENALNAIRLARRGDDFEVLRARIAKTIDWSFEHYNSVDRRLLSALLRAIHFAHDGDGENRLLLKLMERAEALIARDPQLEWLILLARLLLSLSERERYIDHVSKLNRASDLPICQLMSRVADRWGSEKYPDYSAEKICCIGLSRTGTKSLDSALASLGYDTAHWTNPITKNILGKQDYFLFEAFSDITVSADVSWLLENIRCAKFILTERGLLTWERSIRRHYSDVAGVSEPGQLYSKGASRFSGRAAAAEAAVYGGFSCWVDAYSEHIGVVDQIFSKDPERFLRMNVVAGDSWEKLCGFLDKPCPRKPFPHK